jgi:hypothetical protein
MTHEQAVSHLRMVGFRRSESGAGTHLKHDDGCYLYYGINGKWNESVYTDINKRGVCDKYLKIVNQ